MPIETTYTIGKEPTTRYLSPNEFIQRILDSFGKFAFIEDDEVQAQKRLQAQLDEKFPFTKESTDPEKARERLKPIIKALSKGEIYVRHE